MLGPLACALAVLGSAAASTSAPTKLERWAAFAKGKAAPGVNVLQTARGSCSGASRVDPRSDAWRCASQRQTQDPCFSGAASFVICPFGTPDSHDALELKLTRPLPAAKANPPGDPTLRDPWAILTANGAYCYRATGQPTSIAGRTITYACSGAALLAGHPNRSRPMWTIDFLPTSTSSRYRAAAVTTAWW